MSDSTQRARAVRVVVSAGSAALTLGLLAVMLRVAETGTADSLLKSRPEQSEVTSLSLLANRYWESRATRLSDQVMRAHEDLTNRYFAALDETPAAVEPPKADAGEQLTRGEYGVVPPVHVDKNYGYPFPRPVAPPLAVSWHGIAAQARAVLAVIGRAHPLLDGWIALRPEERLTSERGLELSYHLESFFLEADSGVSRLSRQIRYMRSWTQALLPAHSGEPDTTDGETARLLALALDRAASTNSSDADAPWASLRERLLPRRVVKFRYLPERLPSGADGKRHTVSLRIRTDVRDSSFLREFEDAVDMHWNDSPWARARGVRFEISWERIPENRAFKDLRQDLREHLLSLSGDFPALTTGGETTFVTRNVMVLGPGPITPRTLAHEFGHLLGFEDCYLRTISSYGPGGLFGLAVLEWDNPIYGDELMCDNNVGVPSRGAW